eukprot:gnl/TRDRNA2_/TRDRNA2_85263_c0_seq1.p1 gnl/TRDRNA2_/TRDRNA2_85263_c0~~gnl/TRDRNA2_/TRDRNA2_85263_c0_seq1.p1  ORF type:complete len:732 (-),score=173.02 gnl/TRDRNA2_/TRDRNA2_85263_c0_seq1:90-2285(-)
MREELGKNLSINSITVADCIENVEAEVSQWGCNKYMHITRGVALKANRFIELETIFSTPSKEKPVPVAVVCVYFNMDTQTQELTYHFEQENVEHKVGGQSLAPGKFEKWLDRIINDKMQVRTLHGLATPFEETRLQPPPVVEVKEGQAHDVFGGGEEDEDHDVAEVKARLKTRESQEALSWENLPLSSLLANIFDAADEEDEFELTHKEVADLLYATPLGLTDWDIKLLLTTAHELETGKIEYKPFVQVAPEIIEALRKRRAAYVSRGQLTATITSEAIELCFGEEIEEVARAAREAFAAADAAAKGTLSRDEFRTCLMNRTERFSTQEVQMLMQMCKEDDFGQVPYDEIVMLLQQLRIDALHNAMVETDLASLRVHVILLLRREGMGEDLQMPVWSLKNVLLSADQLCLSRMQIHVLLSIVHPNEHGWVDVEYFLRVCCTVIPYMFDAATFMEKASTIAKEKADALAKQELEELQGITSSLAAKRRTNDEDDQEDVQANAPDRDAVEKALIHIGNQHDEKHRQQPTLAWPQFLEAMRHETVQQCQLSEAELRGFTAEADIDDREEIAYVEHIKTWVPIIFELRRSRVYDTILAKDWGLDATHLVDLSEFEEQFPLILPDDMDAQSRPSSRPSSRSSTRTPNLERRSTKSRSSNEDKARARGSIAGTRQSRSRSNSISGGPVDHAEIRRQSKKGGDHSGPRRKKPASRPVSRSGSSDSLDSNTSRKSYGRN